MAATRYHSQGWAEIIADGALKLTAALWFLTAVAGQLVFAFYISGFYGRTAAAGNFAAWDKHLIHGIVDGDLIGNIAVAAHLLMAFVITIGGPIQLIPQIRAYAPTFHHWNGRIYLLTAVAISIGGLYMVWTRGVIGGFPAYLGISLNAILIMFFAAQAVRYAIARDISTHRRWALRLYLAVSGVWFIRVGLMAWIIVNQGPLGNTKDFDGPFDSFIVFASYLVPLAILEIYFRTQDRAGAGGKLAMAGALAGLTALMGLGVFGAYNIMWLPRLMSV